MKALTLRHPWSFAICHWGKRIENRTWKPPASLIGQRFAIHGGKMPTASGLEEVRWHFDKLVKQFGLPEHRVNGDLTLRAVVSGEWLQIGELASLRITDTTLSEQRAELVAIVKRFVAVLDSLNGMDFSISGDADSVLEDAVALIAKHTQPSPATGADITTKQQGAAR